MFQYAFRAVWGYNDRQSSLDSVTLVIFLRSELVFHFFFSVPDYYELHEVSTVLHGTDTGMRLEVMLDQGSEDSQAEKERVLLALLNTKHFAEARRFADLVKLSSDHITRKEVRRSVWKTTPLWKTNQSQRSILLIEH